MPAIYRNLKSKCIEIIQFAFMCTICTRVQICTRVLICTRGQINLHHLEGRSKFAPGCKFAHGCKFLKHRSHGQKYTRVQICTRGANLHPGANCAHERGLNAICIKYINQGLKNPNEELVKTADFRRMNPNINNFVL